MRKFAFKVPRDDPEDQLQRKIVALLDARGVLYCHVPNGGRTSKREGGKRKRRGVKAGVPDLLIFDAPRNCPGKFGAALELKAEDESPSAWKPHQRQWARDLAARGWVTACAFGYAQAVAQLEAWGYL